MNKETNEHWPTVIIMDGKPYQLIKLERIGVNDPCTMCDLRWECDAPLDKFNLIKLCKSDDRDDGWFFAEDWNIFDKRIYDFLNPELANDFTDK